MSKEFIFELDNALYNEETGEAVFKPKVKGELVRCGECKYWEAFKNGVNGWCNRHGVPQCSFWFCADGKRKESNNK